MMKKTFKINEHTQGARLDQTITLMVDSCSRRQSVDLIQKGAVLVNSCAKKAGYKVRLGDQIQIDVSRREGPPVVKPESVSLDIVFEDDHILVVNKNPGMVVHPSPGNYSGTLVNALLFHCPQIQTVGEDQMRPGVVHRLDKDTSGLMVAAKTQQALDFLQKEFRMRRVRKKYQALVFGVLPTRNGVIDLPIGRHPVKRKLMAINHEDGKAAVTLWKVNQQFEKACLVDVLLKTGRTHQIRVHFYAIDHPLVGDLIYQPRRLRKIKNQAPRQMLHSWKLSFRHPYSGKRMTFTSAPPRDFEQMQSELSAG